MARSKNRQLAINMLSSFVAFAVNLGINFFLSPFVAVTESCSLNGINPESYLEDVFRSILFGTNNDKRGFLPCHYQAHELPKMTGLEVAQLLSTAA